MLAPKRIKYRKVQKGRMRGKAYRGGEVAFGQFGLKAMQPGQSNRRTLQRLSVFEHLNFEF